MCARLELLRAAHNNLQNGQIGWEEVFIHYNMVDTQVWMEMVDLTLVLRYLSGEPLKETLQERKVFAQENINPDMDMFLLEVRDKQVLRLVLYADYMISSPTTGIVRGDGSEASVDGAFRTPAGEEAEPIAERVEALTLGPTNVSPINVPPSNVLRPQPQRAATQIMGRPVMPDNFKRENA